MESMVRESSVAAVEQDGLSLSRDLGTILVVEDDPRMQRVLQRMFLAVLVVSAVAEVVDKVLLLELGADDYVTKPFSPRELMARVQAAIRRRRKPAAATAFRFADCEVDFKKMTVQRKGQPIQLTSHEFRLLKFFTDHAERVLSREELLNEVWGYNCYPTTRTVDNQILKLRQKLEPNPTDPRHLLTIYGAGYKFVP